MLRSQFFTLLDDLRQCTKKFYVANSAIEDTKYLCLHCYGDKVDEIIVIECLKRCRYVTQEQFLNRIDLILNKFKKWETEHAAN